MLTRSYVCGRPLAPVLPTTMVPFFKVKLRTVRAGLEPLLEVLAELAALAFLVLVWSAPSVEKFQPPAGERSRVTLGWSMVKPVTWMAREKIRGTNSRFTLRDLAFRNGPVLKDGSSEMAIFSTVTPPERIDKRTFPMSTLRLKAVFSDDSISGRNRLASITQGRRTAAINRITPMPPTI